MKIWLPGPLYKLKPWLIILAAIILPAISENFFTILISIILLCYAAYILYMRYTWRDSGSVTD